MRIAIATVSFAWATTAAFAAVEGNWNSVALTVPEYAPFSTNNWVVDARYFTIAENGDLTDLTSNPDADVSGSVAQVGGNAVFDSNFMDTLLFVDESEEIMSGMFRYAFNAIGMALCLKAPETNNVGALGNSTWNYVEFRYPVSVSFNGSVVHNSSDTPFSETGTINFDRSGGFVLNNSEGSLSGTISALTDPGQFQIQVSIPGEGTLAIPIISNAAYDTLAWVTADPDSVGIFIALRRATDLTAEDFTGFWDIGIVETPTANIFFQDEAQSKYDQDAGYILMRGANKSYAVFDDPESGYIVVNSGQSSVGFDSDDEDAPQNIFINAGKTFGVAAERSSDNYNSLGVFSRRANSDAGVADAQVGSVLLSLRPDETGYDFSFDIETSDDLGDWTSIYNDTVLIPAQGDSQFLRLTAEQ